MNNDKQLVEAIAKVVKANGGRTYYVGGYVRDQLLHRDNKDIDIEIHGIEKEKLENLLLDFGVCRKIGKSFGVYSLDGHSIDIALPRHEKRNGSKHTSFEIEVDPFIGEKEAAKRRDFTINALMQEVLTQKIVDNYHGLEDLHKGIIRYVNRETFVEDSLRVLRGAQFVSRFQFHMEAQTMQLCSSMNLTSLSSERVFDELKKALLKSSQPSLFFETLRQMGQLSYWFEELESLIDVPQNQHYHQEADAWTHTMMVLDQAAKVREQAEYPLAFMLSALCHDLGKPITTFKNDKGIYQSLEHEEKGIAVARTFIKRLTTHKKIVDYVLNMVEKHMLPNVMSSQQSKIKKTNKLFDQSVNPHDLILLAYCDGQGKIPQGKDYRDFLFERLRIYQEYMSRDYVQGKDLIEAGIPQGKQLGSLLQYAHKLRLAGIDKENALKQTLAHAKKHQE